MSTNSRTETASPTTEQELTSKQLRQMRYNAWNFTFAAIFSGIIGLFPLVPMILAGKFLPDIFFAESVTFLVLSLMAATSAYANFHPGRNTESVKMIIFITLGASVMNFLREKLM